MQADRTESAALDFPRPGFFLLKMHIRLITALCAAALLPCSCADDPARGTTFGKDTLSCPVKIPGTDLGFIVYDPAADRVIYSHRRHTPFIPASVTKLATTAAALDILGENFRFVTRLGIRGRIENGTLHGDLVLTGGGDPYLHTPDLMGMVLSLKRLGVSNVRGRFLYDDSHLPRTPRIDSGMDVDAEYNPGLSALSSEQNFILAQWGRNPLTGRDEIFLVPDFPLHRVRIAARPEFGSDRFSLDGDGIWTLRSRRQPEGYERLPVQDPSLFTAWNLQRLGSMQGIRIPAPARAAQPASCTVIHRHRSLPLVELVELILLHSNNPMTELLLLQTVRHMGRPAKELAVAARTLAAWFRTRMPGIDWKDFRLVNGSGLTTENRITPEQLLALLRYASLRPLREGRSYLGLLPVSGVRGSLLRRLNRPETSLRVWAKTGTIFYATTLAGALYTRSGRKLLFAVMCSDQDKRNLYEKTCRGAGRPAALNAAGQWILEKNRQIDELVTLWIKTL